jgi:hypothetical protein
MTHISETWLTYQRHGSHISDMTHISETPANSACAGNLLLMVVKPSTSLMSIQTRGRFSAKNKSFFGATQSAALIGALFRLLLPSLMISLALPPMSAAGALPRRSCCVMVSCIPAADLIDAAERASCESSFESLLPPLPVRMNKELVL